jgi:hypothetical protein
MIKLFMEILSGMVFHFGDKPDRKLIKSNSSHYIAPEGRRTADPHVAVVPDTQNSARSIYDQTEGESDGRGKSNHS